MVYVQLDKTMKKLRDLLKESNYLKYKEFALQKHEGVDDDQRTTFLEAVKLYKEFANVVYKKDGLKEVYENIRHIVDVAGKMTIDETEQWFDGVTVSRHMKRMNESFKLFEKTLKEMYPLQQRLESTYDEIGEVLGKYYEINELEEGNEFGAARAKAIAAGEDEFEVDGKTFPVKSVGKDDKANAKKFAKESVNEDYNGWTNWDTWNANNWLTNDESSYKTARRARDGKQVKKVFLQLFGKNKDDINVNKVDWDEIHDGLNESVNKSTKLTDILKKKVESVNEVLSPFKTSVKDGGMKDLIGKYKQHSKSSDTKKRREVYLQLTKLGQKFQFKQHDWKTLGRVSGAGEAAFKPKYIKQFGESTNEQGLTFHKSTFDESVNEAKKLSNAKVAMLGSKILRKIKIGTQFHTDSGVYTVTGFGRKSNAFQEFDASKSGDDSWKVKLSAMYGVKFEVNDDRRSAVFRKEERLNSIVLESVNKSTKLTDIYKKKVKSVNEAKYDIGMAMKGSGITVYNRAEEEAGDYKNIAHIKPNGMVTYYDKKLPKDIKDMIEKKAQSMK
jgi:hypothetical protein